MDDANDPQGASSLRPTIDTGLTGLALIANYYRIAADAGQLSHELAMGGREAAAEDLLRGANRLGLKARILRHLKPARLAVVPLPALLGLKAGGFAVVSATQEKGRLMLLDLRERSVKTLKPIEVHGLGDGTAILIARRIGGAGQNPKTFNFSWFLPSIWRYRRPLAEVLVASLFIQLFALVTPLFFQLVVDKVLVHHSESTLTVIVIGMVTLGLFETVLQYIRSYTLNHTTNRIDVELGRRLFHHLFRLPLSYFETRPAGQTVARVRELETIRTFLTGQGLTSLLDLLFALVFIGVLMIYSVKLTMVVVGSIPCYALTAFLIRPLLRERVNEKFDRGARSQQFLVESIIGVQTLKAAAVEPIIQARWEERLAAYIRSSFDATQLGTIGQNIIQLIGKIANALVLLLGAKSVIDGDLTVGELIAFNMISAQVTQPILRLSQLWQDFQQVRVSVSRLGDILNAVPEPAPQAYLTMDRPKGAISLKDVTFQYRFDTPVVLNDITLDIAPGEMIGIVGASGSGKSTVTKLVQRLYGPQQGQVFLDGIDIAQVDPGWLRRQLGVVLQENMLFNQSIHENIALGDPAMARTVVIDVAKLAGAHDFIAALPQGYDSLIEERGANLSGGQRQRIAIARALASNPRILIFDEATSALDYESERIIQHNLLAIARGRTMIIVAHRLATVRSCHRIVGMERGQIVEQGTHKSLLAHGGVYARLWELQSSGQEK